MLTGPPEICGVKFRGYRWRGEWLEPGLSLVYTVNAEFLYWALEMPRFRDALNRGDCTADGKWVALLVNLKYGSHVIEHLPGSRMIYRVLDHASREGLVVAIVGSTPRVLAEAARRIRMEWGIEPRVYAPGIIPPDPRGAPEEVERIARLVEEWRPDILFVSLGPPKQELLIDMIRPSLERAGVRLAMGVGGAVNMLAGLEKQAPHIVSRLGLEWLWRLAQNPSRWRKVVRSLRGLACAAREALSTRLFQRSS
ncbi:MAG: WecB/TagA/CpsF family glycosyltransferase [Desulfurococcales archaeon]|nr:WecB/TagA/CpsF family glycosyltransferase [Desulfurococcales archaeon]